jgi:hypothetical protein
MKYTRNLGAGEGIELVKLGVPAAATEYGDGLIDNLTLYQNYPNPFNPSTTIRIDLDKPAKVVLSIYNMNGQRIRTFGEQFHNRGSLEYVWNGRYDDGRLAPSGIYIYQISIFDGIDFLQQSKQMVLLK